MLSFLATYPQFKKNNSYNMSQVDLQPVRKQFQMHDKDTGSCDVQIAVLTKRIEHLTEHLKANTHDHNSRRGLLQLVGKRRRLLRYYKRVNLNGYRDLIAKLDLRK